MQSTSLGRVGKSEEIAGAVAFLLSEAASYITGLNLFVDGVVTAALQYFHTTTNSISQFNIGRWHPVIVVRAGNGALK